MAKFTVTLARDLSEYTEITVEADDFIQAEERAVAEADRNPGRLHWCEGDDREGVYAVDSEEIPAADDMIACPACAARILYWQLADHQRDVCPQRKQG